MHKSAVSSGSNTNWNQKEPKNANQIFGPMAKLEDILFWPSSKVRPKDKFNRRGANQKRNSSIAASPERMANSTSFNSHMDNTT